MTPLIRKSHPIDHTRARARARSRLRSPASGLAVTGRLAAACLLLAGFLDAGSVMAQQKQPVILRVDGGTVTFSLVDEGLGSGIVHHYQLDGSDERVEPADKAAFVVEEFAFVLIVERWMTILPITRSKFRMAFDTDTGDDKDFDTLFEVEVMSSLSPYIRGTDDGNDNTEYNEEVAAPYTTTVDLQLEDIESVEWKDGTGLDSRFGDDDDPFLTYTAIADSVDHDGNADTDKEAIVTATVDGDTLTFALTDKAETAVKNNMGNTRVWVFAHDAAGEYARLQVDVTVIDQTTPKPTEHAIDDVSLAGDGEAKMVDMADLDSEQDGEQPAFSDATQEGLTYTVALDTLVATASVEGSVITLTPVWHADPDPRSGTVTVTAKNNREETSQRTFMVTVTHAIAPIVNEALEAALAAGYELWMTVCDDSLTLDLTDLTLPHPFYQNQPIGPAFINPLFIPGDPLPSGLLFRMPVEDVEASRRYDNLSMENDVFTSAMRITLDPAKATLTITPYGYNSALITIRAVNRANMLASMTLPAFVSSCPVSTEDSELPKEVELSQNYPNPFNPQTTIDYALPQTGDVSLIVYDMLGREMNVLIADLQAAGRYTVHFDAEHLPNGAYVYRLVAGKKIITRTMVLVK